MIDEMTKALAQCTLNNNNNNVVKGATLACRRLSKDEQPLKNFRSRTESVTSNTSENSQKQPSLYKTELCRSFEEHGSCRYGKKCQFAHSTKELRQINRHPKYKTEMCESFHTTGYCPYGSRCHFIHNIQTSKQDIRKIKSHDENLSDLRESHPGEPPFTIGNFESDWPKMDSSPLHLSTTRSLNSVGGSSGSIWRNQSESSFSAGFDHISDYGLADYGPAGSTSQPSFCDDGLMDGGGLTLGGRNVKNDFGPAVGPFVFSGDGFDPWEETRLPVFRHLSKRDAEKV